jgi:hypothetical protein
MKVKVWQTDSSGFERPDSGPTEALIDAGVRSVRCMRAPVHGFAGISAEPDRHRLAGVVVAG